MLARSKIVCVLPWNAKKSFSVPHILFFIYVAAVWCLHHKNNKAFFSAGLRICISLFYGNTHSEDLSVHSPTAEGPAKDIMI